MSYIYKITNMINGKTYIGKHSANKTNYMGSGSLIRNAIRKYKVENFKKEILIEGDFNIKLLDELEIHYIRLYSPHKTKNSYNLSPGGNNQELGKKRDITTGQKISIALTGKIPSEETKRRQSISHSKLIGSKNPSYKKYGNIIQMDKNNNIIKIWETSSSVVADELNIPRSSLSMNLCGKNKTCHGFKFKYEKEVTIVK